VVHQKVLTGGFATAAQAEAELRACFEEVAAAPAGGGRRASATRPAAAARGAPPPAVLALLDALLSEDGEGAGGGWMGPQMRTKPLGRDRLNRQYWWFGWPQGWLAIEALPAERREKEGERVVPSRVQVSDLTRTRTRTHPSLPFQVGKLSLPTSISVMIIYCSCYQHQHQ